ncbi:MAG: hypothetical protein ORN26_02300 [Candidatus Pacebacteria bacterium]|nr:hypothetical protein [Candidatus Paceibacterota bacterium]
MSLNKNPNILVIIIANIDIIKLEAEIVPLLSILYVVSKADNNAGIDNTAVIGNKLLAKISFSDNLLNVKTIINVSNNQASVNHFPISNNRYVAAMNNTADDPA